MHAAVTDVVTSGSEDECLKGEPFVDGDYVRRLGKQGMQARYDLKVPPLLEVGQDR